MFLYIVAGESWRLCCLTVLYELQAPSSFDKCWHMQLHNDSCWH